MPSLKWLFSRQHDRHWRRLLSSHVCLVHAAADADEEDDEDDEGDGGHEEDEEDVLDGESAAVRALRVVPLALELGLAH